jgi:thioredoxin reductase (NADPH)
MTVVAGVQAQDEVVQVYAATRSTHRVRPPERDRGRGTDRLQELVLRDAATGRSRTVRATALFVLIGGHPHTDWLPPSIHRDQHGFVLTGHDLPTIHAALPLETSMPGVFAAGDIRHGSIKRVASAVGDGGISIRSVHQRLAGLRETETTAGTNT